MKLTAPEGKTGQNSQDDPTHTEHKKKPGRPKKDPKSRAPALHLPPLQSVALKKEVLRSPKTRLWLRTRASRALVVVRKKRTLGAVSFAALSIIGIMSEIGKSYQYFEHEISMVTRIHTQGVGSASDLPKSNAVSGNGSVGDIVLFSASIDSFRGGASGLPKMASSPRCAY